MNFWEIIILFFSFQAFCLAILLLLKRSGDRLGNKIFASLLFLFSYNLFFNVLYWSHFSEPLFAFFRFSYTIPLSLYGPLFYMYIRRVATGSAFYWRDTIHLIPLGFVLFQFGSFYVLPLSTKMELVASQQEIGFTNYIPWVYPCIVILMMAYCLYTYFRFKRYFTDDSSMRIWLKAISLVFFLYTTSHVLYAGLTNFYDVSTFFDYLMTLCMTTLVGLVSYFAFMLPAVFNGLEIRRVIPFVKYERTGLSQEFSLELKQKLLQLMEGEKPYLNNEIRLDHIADMLDISRHHASQIINQHFSMHFFDFINEYRIREAEHMLQDPKSPLSITDIAFQSGFNNRISFYKAFKKVMGVSPTEYRDHSIAS